MITDALLRFFLLAINFILNPILKADNVFLPVEISNYVGTATTYLQAIGDYFPVSTILAIFTIYISLEAGIFTYKFIMWVLKRFPTQS